MKKLIVKLLNDEKIKYLIAGGCTTLVNIVSFFLLRSLTSIDRNVCNVIAIVLAIIFAYVANKLYVFKHHTGSVSELIREMLSFAGARIISMLVEVLGFALLCDSFRMTELWAKIIVQFIVVVINYVFSKLFVFKERKESITEKIKRNWSWLLAMGITFIFMIFVMICAGVAPFGEKSFTIVDSIHQYLPFFSDYRDKLINEGSLFYTFDMGMGGNFQSLLLYYMASPLNLIIILFKRNNIHAAMSLLIMIKMVISAGAFGYFLSRRKNKISNNFFVSAFGVAYALNAFMIGYSWNLMWLDCIMILPLIVLGLERIIEKKSPKLYCLALFYCLYCNYYISFIICLFLILWFLVSRHNSVKEFFVNGLKFAGYSILSAGMAAFSLFTAYFAIMTTASASAGFPKAEWYGNIFDILKQHLFLTEPITNQTFDGGANLYCGMLTVFLLFVYMFSGRIKLSDKIKKGLLLILLIISFNNTFLNYIWHGFHDQYGIPNRFAFVYIFTLLVMGYEAIVRIKNMDAAFIMSAMFLALAFIFMCKYESKLPGEFSGWTVVGFSAILVIIYTVLVILRAGNKIKPIVSSSIISLIFVIEIIVNAALGYNSNGFADAKYYMSKVDKMEKSVDFVAEYAESKNYGFYREDIVNPIMLDEATLNNMRSIGTFCSTVRGDVVDAMGEMGFYTGANEYLYTGATAVTNSMLGVRFIYAETDDYFPETTFNELLANRNETLIYENKYALPIAYAVNNSILDWNVSDGNAFDCQNNFIKYACDGDEIFSKVNVEKVIEGENCNAGISEKSNDIVEYFADTTNGVTITTSFRIPKDGNYYIEIRGNYIYKLRIIVNGEEKGYDRYQTQTLNLGDLKENDDISIKTVFSDGCSDNGTISVRLKTINKENFEEANQRLSEYPLEVKEYKDGYISGEISVDKDMILFTSIPYDEGWKIYVDGKLVEEKKVGKAFMGVELSEGTHKIEMKFFPYGLKYGIIISVLAWGVFFVIITKNKQNNRRNKQ